MSMTKRSAAFDREMEERRYADRRDYDLEYREWQYLHGAKQTQQKPNKPQYNVEQRKERK